MSSEVRLPIGQRTLGRDPDTVRVVPIADTDGAAAIFGSSAYSSPCCARAAIGHAAAVPSSVMNSRRLIIR
jgi:hypothetical protein